MTDLKNAILEFNWDFLNTDPYNKYEITIVPGKECDFVWYCEYIKILVERGDKIPARVLRKLGTFIIDTQKEADEKLTNLKSQIVTNVYEKHKSGIYDFCVTEEIEISGINLWFWELSNKKSHDPKKKSHIHVKEYNLQSMIKHAVDKTIHHRNNIKGFVITHLYHYINEYFKGYAQECPLSDYGKNVIVGEIAMQFGFTLSSKKNLTNAQIHQRVKHYTNQK